MASLAPSPAAPGEDLNLTEFAAELAQNTAQTLIIATLAALLAVALLAVPVATDSFSMAAWLILLVLALPSYAALRLVPAHLLAAVAVWQVGLAAAITLALLIFGQREIALLLALLPLMAVVTLRWPAGLVAEALVVLLSWQLYALPKPGLLPPQYTAAVAALGAFVGLIGWAASRSLHTVTRWSFESYRKAWQHMNEARERRAQLARVVKDLDLAYYRLERTNAALIAAWQAAAKAERFRSEFATNLSHELRTPLSLIIGFCEMIVTAPEKYGGVAIPAPYRSDLNAVYHNARQLVALVNDVLDMARLDAGKLALAREDADLASIITEAVSMVREYVEAKGLRLDVEIDPRLPRLWVDRLRIRQVLLNLLVNAARFTERGSIQVEAHRAGKGVTIRVRDTGRGIPHDELPRIFEEFRETGASPAAGWASSGLGLPISKRFVELHGGSMGVESAYQRGTTFWFTLPYAGDQPPEPETPCLLAAQPIEGRGVFQQTIVCVHDDMAVRSLLQRHLSGYRVIGATSIDEGVRLAAQVRAIALITDSDGKVSDVESDVPLIRCPLPNARQTARLVGAHDYLVKPFSSQELWASIDSLGAPVQRVLVADDDPDMVRLVRRMLAPRIAPRDCLEAPNGEEALRLMREQEPDVVLLDLVMPKVDGHEVLARRAQDPRLAGIPIIIISARDEDDISGTLAPPIVVSRAGGWRLEEVVRVLEANLSALACKAAPVVRSKGEGEPKGV